MLAQPGLTQSTLDATNFDTTTVGTTNIDTSNTDATTLHSQKNSKTTTVSVNTPKDTYLSLSLLFYVSTLPCEIYMYIHIPRPRSFLIVPTSYLPYLMNFFILR